MRLFLLISLSPLFFPTVDHIKSQLQVESAKAIEGGLERLVVVRSSDRAAEDVWTWDEVADGAIADATALLDEIQAAIFGNR